MINKQSIYYWFFFPLLALLSAGSLTSCIYDSVLEETDTSGKSTLSITMRGITTTDPSTSGGSYDDYVKTLRVIGYDNTGDVVCNQLFDYVDNNGIPNFKVTESDEVNITQTLEDAFQGGVCDFYFIANEFIANEDGYSVYNSQTTLSEYLNTDPKKDALDQCMIATPTDLAILGSSPILMTTSVRSTLKPGDNTINNIELVRCFAKVQLKIIDKTGSATVGENPVLTGTCPEFYSLLDVGTYTSWTGEEGNYSVNLTMTQEGSTYTSQEIYFPERLFAQGENIEVNALKFSFTLNDKPYTEAVADATGTDFNIRRNTHYTVIATLKKKETVTFNVMVNAWGEKKMDVPAFE